MHGILCAGQQQPGSWSQKSEFSKIVSLLKFCTNFLFPVSPDITDTFLFNKVFDWSMFRASWAWLCVWGKFCKFLKNQNQIFWKDPLCKKSKTFFILVSPDITDTFLFNKIFGWSKFSRVWVWICVCRRSKNRQKKRPKKRQKSLLRSSIRVSPDFNLARHSSPSFGSQHLCSAYSQ